MENEKTEKELFELLGVTEVQSINEVKENYEFDFSEIVDTNIDSIYETLIYNGFTDNQIIERVKARYGAVIDVYYLKDENCFYMFFGSR